MMLMSLGTLCCLPLPNPTARAREQEILAGGYPKDAKRRPAPKRKAQEPVTA